MKKLTELVAARIREEHRKHSRLAEWPEIAAAKLLATPEFRSGWTSLERDKPLPGAKVDVWVVPKSSLWDACPLMPYRCRDIVFDGQDFRAGLAGPIQHDVTHWMPAAEAPSNADRFAEPRDDGAGKTYEQ